MNLMELVQHPWAEHTGWVLLHSIWQLTLLGAAGILISRLCRRWSDEAQYRVLGALLALCVLTPAITAFSIAEDHARLLTASPDPAQAETTERIHGGSDNAEAGSPATLSSATPVPEAEAAPQGDEITSPSFPGVLALCWLFVTMLLAGRLTGGWYRLQRQIRRDADELSQPWLDVAWCLQQRIGLRRNVRWLQSAAGTVPFTCGVLRSVIVFPSALLTGLNRHQIECLMLHELAHVHRHDFFINLLQCAAETLFFYHPVIWWLSRRMRQLREEICDSVVVSVQDSPQTPMEYSRALLYLASAGQGSRQLTAASGGDMKRRIERLHGIRRNSSAAVAVSISGVTLLLGTILMVLSASSDRDPKQPDPGGTVAVNLPLQDTVVPGSPLEAPNSTDDSSDSLAQDTPLPANDEDAPQPPRSLHVRVVDARTGEPIAGARYPDIVQRIVDTPKFSADRNGEFHVHNIRRRGVTFQVAGPPDTNWLTQCESVLFQPDQLEHSMTVALRQGVRLQGQVLQKESEQAVADVTVYVSEQHNLASQRSSVTGHTRTDDNGRFHLIVPPGRYLVSASLPSSASESDPTANPSPSTDAGLIVDAEAEQPVTDLIVHHTPVAKKSTQEKQVTPMYISDVSMGIRGGARWSLAVQSAEPFATPVQFQLNEVQMRVIYPAQLTRRDIRSLLPQPRAAGVDEEQRPQDNEFPQGTRRTLQDAVELLYGRAQPAGRQPRIRGRLISADGQPMSGVPLYVARRETKLDRSALRLALRQVSPVTATDSEGFFDVAFRAVPGARHELQLDTTRFALTKEITIRIFGSETDLGDLIVIPTVDNFDGR